MIRRDLGVASSGSYDLAIVGGGVYGATLALEAARRGLRPVLVERADFGGATTWNSLRIVHGGLRYLQSLDLARFRESVAERRWFLRSFPGLVRPLACLLPLYGRGLKRPPVMRAALAANDLLSSRRNDGVDPGLHIPSGRILTPDEVLRRCPDVDARGLQGGAMWHDASMPDSQRVVMEVLRWACARGAVALNYVEAVALRVSGGKVAGIACRDRAAPGGADLELRAPLVVSCAGPWVRTFAAQAGSGDDPSLFRPSLAFNVLLDREPPAACALAVQPRRPGAPIYFLHPWKGKVLAGTVHAPWTGAPDRVEVPPPLLRAYLADLSEALPRWKLSEGDVLRVHAGLLPAREEGTARLAVRPVLRDHGRGVGPSGFWSVSGVKFTTARRVAQDVLRALPVRRARPMDRPPEPAAIPSREEMEELLDRGTSAAMAAVARIVREEAVVRPEDLLLRRTDWGSDPRDEARLSERLGSWVEAAR